MKWIIVNTFWTGTVNERVLLLEYENEQDARNAFKIFNDMKRPNEKFRLCQVLEQV